jgi:hypothetical protein
MSVWVAPSIAAEYWNVPVDHVMSQIRSGAITSKIDTGFLVVDVRPDSPTMVVPPSQAIAVEQTKSYDAHRGWGQARVNSSARRIGPARRAA